MTKIMTLIASNSSNQSIPGPNYFRTNAVPADVLLFKCRFSKLPGYVEIRSIDFNIILKEGVLVLTMRGLTTRYMSFPDFSVYTDKSDGIYRWSVYDK